MEVGLITPPVGLNLFVINAIAPQIPTVSRVLRGSPPYVLVMFLGILILCFFPEIATWLPDYVMGPISTTASSFLSEISPRSRNAGAPYCRAARRRARSARAGARRPGRAQPRARLPPRRGPGEALARRDLPALGRGRAPAHGREFLVRLAG